MLSMCALLPKGVHTLCAGCTSPWAAHTTAAGQQAVRVSVCCHVSSSWSASALAIVLCHTLVSHCNCDSVAEPQLTSQHPGYCVAASQPCQPTPLRFCCGGMLRAPALMHLLPLLLRHTPCTSARALAAAAVGRHAPSPAPVNLLRWGGMLRALAPCTCCCCVVTAVCS